MEVLFCDNITERRSTIGYTIIVKTPKDNRREPVGSRFSIFYDSSCSGFKIVIVPRFSSIDPSF